MPSIYYVIYTVIKPYVVARLISWCDVLILSRNYVLIFAKLGIRCLNTVQLLKPLYATYCNLYKGGCYIEFTRTVFTKSSVKAKDTLK